ncbi:peptidase inhibitor family I36 protein [Streptomyces sp. WMMB 322]|uniref:peptidase inhibitor family I36 protein n=1 Tax=Streptomyces sp. WMMB 322 TaxID=1286821 RepID=UPI0006E3DDBE|nr:peptidase inhibitor family I36 protein [Streptomyces sp. WMMB 322]SCK40545.1 hypothetical protein H180DRAFT_03499 [Streptomyces sp. WMMB 322]
MRGVVAAALALGALAAGTAAAPPRAAAGPRLGDCAAGALCMWPDAPFRGERREYALSGVSLGSCERFPGRAGAASFANRTGRPVTVYESGECAETREFHTHPSGSWTPEGAYRMRAFKVWER